MGAGATAAVSPRRPRARAYLLLSRLSNLPTVWSNVLAGAVASGAVLVTGGIAGVAAGVSLLYTAGMFLNDLADAGFDRLHRVDRPIPRGDVSAREVGVAGVALLAAGAGVVLLVGPSVTTVVALVALGAAIVYYDYHHKQNPFGPLVMGLCRGLVYVVAASAVGRAVPTAVVVAAVAMTAYVVGLTVVAKRLGPRGGPAVPVLLAGISLVDALVVLVCGGGMPLAAVAALGFPLTLVLQRVVPGT